MQKVWKKRNFPEIRISEREQVSQKIRMFQAEIFACNRRIFLDNADAMCYDIV